MKLKSFAVLALTGVVATLVYVAPTWAEDVSPATAPVQASDSMNNPGDAAMSDNLPATDSMSTNNNSNGGAANPDTQNSDMSNPQSSDTSANPLAPVNPNAEPAPRQQNPDEATPDTISGDDDY